VRRVHLMLRSLLGVVFAAALIPPVVFGQRVETGFLDRSIVDAGGMRWYQIFVPRGYSPDREWPLILFLHGGGEAGNDGHVQTEIGLGSAIRRHVDRFPAIVVFPQLRPDSRWNGQEAALALKMLRQAEDEFATDPKRVYLTGLSRGGAGAWYIAYRDPERFAALLVVCGRVTPASTLNGKPLPDQDPVVPPTDGEPFAAVAERVKSLPIWVFHGDADETISVEESRSVTSALRDGGASVAYSELPGVGHNAWDAAYGSAEVMQWLFAQRRSSR